MLTAYTAETKRNVRRSPRQQLISDDDRGADRYPLIQPLCVRNRHAYTPMRTGLPAPIGQLMWHIAARPKFHMPPCIVEVEAPGFEQQGVVDVCRLIVIWRTYWPG